MKVLKYPVLIALLAVSLWSCDKGSLKPNQAPDTFIALESINLDGENRLNSVVGLSWYGTDVDGYIIGYELSYDQLTWQFTTRQDSLFKFSIPPGSDTVDVTLYVRAIDDKGVADPSPDSLRIPLKNSPPQAAFDDANLPGDTAICVTTYRWFATDPDGDNTIVQAEMRWNNGDWYDVDWRQPLITFVADTTSTGQAKVFYANSNTAEAQPINGILLNQQNTLYVRIKDIAGSISPVDTAAKVYIRKPTSRTLVICGQPASVSAVYLPVLAQIGVNHDFLDFAVNNGAKQPKFWVPTFKHILNLFETAFIYTDASTYNSAATGQTALLLNFMGQGVQRFTDSGRKLLVSTTFASTSDVVAISGIYPIEDIVRSTGQVRLSNDSSIYSVAGSNYPSLKPENILIGLFPIIKSADADDFYRAQLTRLSGWQGDNLMASRRKYNGNVNHVFFGIGLFQFTKNPGGLNDLFEEILLNDFNW